MTGPGRMQKRGRSMAVTWTGSGAATVAVVCRETGYRAERLQAWYQREWRCEQGIRVERLRARYQGAQAKSEVRGWNGCKTGSRMEWIREEFQRGVDVRPVLSCIVAGWK